MDISRALILELMLNSKKITEKDLEKIQKLQAKATVSLEETIISAQIASEDEIAAYYSDYFKVPRVDAKNKIEGIEPPGNIMPEKFARDNRVYPFGKKSGTLYVAMVDPSDVSLIQEVQLYTGYKVSAYVGTVSMISQGLDEVFGVRNAVKEIASELSGVAGDVAKETDEEIVDLNKIIPETRETQVIRLLNGVMTSAIKERASDIHIEPFPEEIKIRFRVDGNLKEVPPPPKSLYVPLISRIKIVCKMDIAEKRIPQDGAFSLKLEENQIDIRVSTIPTVYGEKCVMRILNKNAVPLDLHQLGFEQRQYEDFIAAAESPHGLIFVTGPTGSGKSTTLYATLKRIMSPEINIMTAEDPVEYKFTGINQVQTKAQVGLTFASALRSFLRQDPDVIMVGEVRDGETAEICLRAALTGHLVLSTLHTNSAIEAITRLENMGIEPFLVGSTLRVVEAQRLIRRLCKKCKAPDKVPDEVAAKYGFEKGQVIYKPQGCPECSGGYRGRVGIYEVIKISPALGKMIEERKSISDLKEQVKKEGMKFLFENALTKVKDGVTSLEEAMTLMLAGEE